jgi:hypothetical protein
MDVEINMTAVESTKRDYIDLMLNVYNPDSKKKLDSYLIASHFISILNKLKVKYL